MENIDYDILRNKIMIYAVHWKVDLITIHETYK